MAATEHDLLRRASQTILDLIGLADSLYRYGSAFPGEPRDDLAVKNARELLDEIDSRLSVERGKGPHSSAPTKM